MAELSMRDAATTTATQPLSKLTGSFHLMAPLIVRLRCKDVGKAVLYISISYENSLW